MAKNVVHLGPDQEAAVAAACDALARGGVVAFPTETVYGVGVVAGDDEALARLRRLKGREADKPFQLLVSGRDMALDLGAEFSPGACRAADALWPGPLTIVVPSRHGGTLGLRMPRSAFMLAVLRRLGRAVASSSANPAGLPPPVDAAAADAFADRVDLLVDGGPCEERRASTVVRADGDDFTILRAGALDEPAIRAVWHI